MAEAVNIWQSLCTALRGAGSLVVRLGPCDWAEVNRKGVEEM